MGNSDNQGRLPSLPRSLNLPSVWVTAIAISLGGISLNMFWRAEDFNLFGLGVLFFLAVSSQLWERRESLTFESGIFASFFGATLLVLLLIKSLFLTGGSLFTCVFPLFSAVGLGLIACCFKGLKQYWQELLLLLVLTIPNVLASWLVDYNPSLVTAKFASYLLWYLGFDVTRQGTSLYLTGGAVNVRAGCSGLETMLYMLSLALLTLAIFPAKQYQKILVPLVAVVLGFILNGLRVSLMAILVDASNWPALTYWHDGEGSFVFSAIGSLLLGLFWVFLINKNEEAETR